MTYDITEERPNFISTYICIAFRFFHESVKGTLKKEKMGILRTEHCEPSRRFVESTNLPQWAAVIAVSWARVLGKHSHSDWYITPRTILHTDKHVFKIKMLGTWLTCSHVLAILDAGCIIYLMGESPSPFIRGKWQGYIKLHDYLKMTFVECKYS